MRIRARSPAPGAGDHDWGSFELSDEDGPTPAFAGSRARSAEPAASMAGGKGDSLRLRSYIEPNAHDGTLALDALPHGIVGIYADPAAKKDDWAADFELELGDAAHADPTATSPFLEALHDTVAPSAWIPPPDSPVINKDVFSRLNIPPLDIGSAARLPPSVAQQGHASADTQDDASQFENTPTAQLPPLGPRVPPLLATKRTKCIRVVPI